MNTILLDLLNVSISVSWLVVAVLLLRFCFPKAPKYVRCLLWGLVGVRLLLPFSIKSDFSLLPSSQTFPDEIVYAQIPSVNTGILSVDTAINPVIGQALAPQVGDSVNPVQVWLAIGGAVWLVGMIGMFLYAVGSYWSVRRCVREAALLFDNVYHGDRVPSPFILGLFRPRIYLPSDMSEDDRAYVLAHEQAHLARRDHLWKPLGFALLSVYWFNPLLWVAYIFLCRDIEFACDEKVLATYGEYGEEQKKAYADALINCSAPRKQVSACPLAFGENGVKGRIKSVLHYKKPAFWVVVAALLTCIAVAVCFLTDPKDEWQSSNHGIVGTVSGAECENVGFHYREGSINHEAPHITVQLKNDTNDTLCYGEKFTLLRDGEPCPTLQDPRWKAILKMLPPTAETSQTYYLTDYDLSQNGHYRLETEVYFKSDPATTYIAYVEFGIDRIYSFVGWQYAGEHIVYGNDNAADARYTDDTIPNVYITEDSVRLQIAQSGEWHELGALTQDKLDRNNFDYMLTEAWWDAGYSAKILRENNKHVVSYVDSGANERYYLLEQKNGEIYLAVGRIGELDWIFRLIPVGQTQLLSTSTSTPNTPTAGCVVTKAPVTLNGISFSTLRCEEKEGGLFMTVQLKNNTDKTITFGPEFTLLHNQRKIYPNEGHAWDTILYTLAPGKTFEETLNISACVAKGEYQLQKSVWFEPRTETPVAFPVTLTFTLPETRKTTFRYGTTTASTTVESTDTTESTTTATTRPTFGTQTTRLDGGAFRSDIVIQLEKTEYAVNETLYFSLTNNAGEEITYGEQYFLFQQVGEEQWEIYPNTTGTHKAIAYVVKVNGVSKRNAVKLSQYSLTVGQLYKVALQINGEWVVSDEFTAVEARVSATQTTVSQPATTPTPAFSATVLQVTDEAVLVEINAVEAGPAISGQAWISTDVKWSHPVPQFTVGMQIDILYDGIVQETYPLQIPTVYTICDCEYQLSQG